MKNLIDFSDIKYIILSLQVLTLPLDMLSTENIGSDIFHGCFVVTCTLFAFIGLVWLREQILHGGGPDWLEREEGGWPAGNQQLLAPQPAPANNNVVEPQVAIEVRMLKEVSTALR